MHCIRLILEKITHLVMLIFNKHTHTSRLVQFYFPACHLLTFLKSVINDLIIQIE